MKISDEARKAVKFADDKAEKIGNALTESAGTSLTEEEQQAAQFTLAALKLTEGGKLPDEKDLEKLQKKVDNIKTSSIFIDKIKNWLKAFVDFLKSPFDKRGREELATATEEVVEEVVAIQKKAVKQPSRQARQSVVEVQSSPANIDFTEQARRLSQQKTSEVTQLQRDSSIPLPPPSPPFLPNTPPPPLVNINQKLQARSPQIGDLLRQIEAGAKLKKVENRVLGDVKDTNPGGFIDELTKVLARRKGSSGAHREAGGPSQQFLRDAAEFAKAREEEAARQARQEAIDGPRIAVALKKEQEEAANLSMAKNTPIAKTFVMGESGIPVPPPPPSLSSLHKQSKAMAVIKTDKPVVVREPDNKQFKVDSGDIQKIKGNLRKVAQKTTTSTIRPAVAKKPTSSEIGR